MQHDATNMFRSAFGKALDEDALIAFRHAAEEQFYAPGEVIVRQGEIGDALYVISTGRASSFSRPGRWAGDYS